MVRYSWFAEQFRGTKPETPKETNHYARGFLMFLFSTTLFANRANTVGLYLLSALVDLSQLWVYAYFRTLTPESEVETPFVVPYSHRYDDRFLWRTWETFPFFCWYFDIVTVAEATMPTRVRDRFAGALEASHFWLLFEGPVCQTWFLGERFLRQAMGLPEPVFKGGLEADYFRGEGDYSTFIRTHLMPPLTGIRRGGEARASTARERARVPRATRATRTHGGGATQAGQRTGWPELPTTLTSLARSRGRARGTRDESGSSEPILSDDDAETSGSEEVVSPQSESPEIGGDDIGLGSESGDADIEAGSETESRDGTSSDSGLNSDSGANETVPQSPFLRGRG
ncbi:hypothetical protein CsSME_00046744 [Camellia sinensis var. sinensis]